MNSNKARDIRSTLQWAAAELKDSGSVSYHLDAEVLLSRFLKMDRLALYKNPEKLITDEEFSGFAGWLERRCSGEPVAYIIGRKEFWSLEFEVDHNVIIPRPETEILIEEALKVFADRKEEIRILDIGTGSGAIGISLAYELKNSRVVATDISAGAIEIAGRNARRNGVAARIDFLLGSLFGPVAGEFDLIVSNPPYISAGEFETLPRGVKDFEPREALLAGVRGTEFYETIIGECNRYLKAGGWIFMEIGATQRPNVEEILVAAGIYDRIAFRCDYAGLDRVAVARRKE